MSCEVVFGAPVIYRYDLLCQLIVSVNRSTVQPDRIVIVNNGVGTLLADPKQEEINRHANVGVAGAWNLILESARSPESKVIIANDDVELGPNDLKAIVDWLDQCDLVLGSGMALFGMRRRLVDVVGWFDENFFPAYFEDNDYLRRVMLQGVNYGRVKVDATHVGSASRPPRTGKWDEFDLSYAANKRRYWLKWGGMPGDERNKIPFKGKPPRGWRERPVTT